MKDKKVPIGKIIKAQLHEEYRSVAWLSKKMNHSYSSLCKILKQDHIDTELLLKICDILDYDFFACFSTFLKEKKVIIFSKSGIVEK